MLFSTGSVITLNDISCPTDSSIVVSSATLFSPPGWASGEGDKLSLSMSQFDDQRGSAGFQSVTLLSTSDKTCYQGMFESEPLDLVSYVSPLQLLVTCNNLIEPCDSVYVQIQAYCSSINGTDFPVLGQTAANVQNVSVSASVAADDVDGSQPLAGTFNLAALGTFGNSSAVCAPRVRDQLMCGSCYAFSATAVASSSLCFASEGLLASSVLDLSPQQVLNQRFNDYSGLINPCAGGQQIAEINRIGSRSTIEQCTGPSLVDTCSRQCLPYAVGGCTEADGDYFSAMASMEKNTANCSFSQTTCNPGFSTIDLSASPALPPGGQLLGFRLGKNMTKPSTILAVQQWLMTKGPVTVSIDASCPSMASHNATWLQAGAPPLGFTWCNQSVNHAVTITGWATVGEVTMWIIQNSWNSKWCDQGFFYVPFSSVGTGPEQMRIESPVGAFFETDPTIVARARAIPITPAYIDDGKPGAPFMLDPAVGNNVAEIAEVTGFYAQSVSANQSALHTIHKVVSIYKQVVNGHLYHLNITLRSNTTGLLFSHSTVIHRPASSSSSSQLSLLVVRATSASFSEESAGSSSSSSSSSSLSARSTIAIVSVGAAVSGIALLGMAAFFMIMRRRRRAQVDMAEQLVPADA